MPQVYVQLPSGQTFSTQVPIEEMEAFSQVMHLLAERLHLRLGMAAGIIPEDLDIDIETEEPQPTETKQLKAPDKSMPPGNYTKKPMSMAEVQPPTLTPTPFRKASDDEAGTDFDRFQSETGFGTEARIKFGLLDDQLLGIVTAFGGPDFNYEVHRSSVP